MVDATYALDGGSEAKRWLKRHSKRKCLADSSRKRRKAQEAREARYDREQRRRARVAAIEKVEKTKWRAARKAQGYTIGLPYKDLVGKRYGLLTVVKPGGHRKSGAKKWWVRCDCGSPLKEVSGTNLKQGNIRSCGCYGRAGLRKPWHSAKYYARQKARLRAAAKEAKRPLSTKLLDLRRKHKPSSKEAKLITQVRDTLIAYELLLGLRKPRKEWKTDRYKRPKFVH